MQSKSAIMVMGKKDFLKSGVMIWDTTRKGFLLRNDAGSKRDYSYM